MSEPSRAVWHEGLEWADDVVGQADAQIGQALLVTLKVFSYHRITLIVAWRAVQSRVRTETRGPPSRWLQESRKETKVIWARVVAMKVVAMASLEIPQYYSYIGYAV